MKKFLKNIIKWIAALISFFLHRRLIHLVSVFITYTTTAYVARQLKRCGKNPIIYYPVTTHGMQYVSIGDDFCAYSRLRLEAHDTHGSSAFTPQIVIGNNVSINYDCHIASINKVVIGNNVLIGSKVFIADHFHGDTDPGSLAIAPNSRQLVSKGSVIIEDNVWIGEGVAIMPNTVIGHNSIIGANAVVTKDIPPFTVAAGIPAKPIRSLHE